VLVSQALRSGEILLELVGMVLDLRKIEAGELALECSAFRTADLLRDAQLLSVLVKRKVTHTGDCSSCRLSVHCVRMLT
jgi:signal transduction histidine kinase